MLFRSPEDVDTDVKRKAKFLKGLSDELKIPLTVAYAPTYQTLLDQAITLDDSLKKAENRKRKLGINKHHAESSFKKHSSHDSHRHNGHHKHHDHNGGLKGSNGDHKGNGHAGNNNNGQHRPNPELKKDISHITCYKCRNKGHYSNECPEKKAEEATKSNPFDKGYVNHINVEEVNGTF